ncbi:MAG: hypothetical protein R3B60_00505 [Candidatus Paceibacterota bacterium]
MKNSSSNIRRVVMRRVWYSYLLSIFVSYSTLFGFIFGVSSFVFIKLVSVGDVVSNLLAVQVGAVPDFIYNTFAQAIANGEFMTLLTLGLIIFSLLSWRFQGHFYHRVIQYA